MTYTEIVLEFAARREQRRRDIAGMRLAAALSLALWAVAAGVAWLVL